MLASTHAHKYVCTPACMPYVCICMNAYMYVCMQLQDMCAYIYMNEVMIVIMIMIVIVIMIAITKVCVYN